MASSRLKAEAKLSEIQYVGLRWASHRLAADREKGARVYDTRMTSVLTGASVGQLSNWRSDLASAGALLKPAHRSSTPYLYSFEDVVALRGFVKLRRSTSLQKIRRAVGYLREMHPDTHLSRQSLRAYPGGESIVWISDDGEYIDIVEKPGQLGIKVVMEEIFEAFRTDAGRIVPDLSTPAIGLSIDMHVRGGFPVLAGTRLPFNAVSSLARDGLNEAEIRALYPSATPAGIAGAVSFASLVEANEAA